MTLKEKIMELKAAAEKINPQEKIRRATQEAELIRRHEKERRRN
jgi:hypothetical protein